MVAFDIEGNPDARLQNSHRSDRSRGHIVNEGQRLETGMSWAAIPNKTMVMNAVMNAMVALSKLLDDWMYISAVAAPFNLSLTTYPHSVPTTPSRNRFVVFSAERHLGA